MPFPPCFATAIFGIPIGILGSGFESVIEEETVDDERELDEEGKATEEELVGTPVEKWCYRAVNIYSTPIGMAVQPGMIFVAIFIGVLQTVKGHENDFALVESFTVYYYMFTLEWLLRFIGAGADPIFATNSNGLMARLKFVFSFYSSIDLLAFVPYYAALALPGSVIDQYDECLRMSQVCSKFHFG